jgi:acyl-CoA reductase-like NAD-dependent aldehyde dehydrogenase
LHGGEFSDSAGFWIQPTFFEVNTDEHELLYVEVFGPVTAIRPVENIEHAIRILERSTYRLTGAVWSRTGRSPPMSRC